MNIGKCAVCGGSFNKTRCSQKYCSQKCANKARSKVQHARKISKKQIYEKVCRHCGKTFETTKSNVVYCSVACHKKQAQLRRANDVSVIPGWKKGQRYCLVCGKPFQPKRRSSVTCSDTCYNKMRSSPVLLTKLNKDKLTKEDERIYYKYLPNFSDPDELYRNPISW